MKRLLYALLFIGVAVSCKKELQTHYSDGIYFENVKAGLKDSLSITEFSRLNFKNAILSKSEQDQLYFLRIPFLGEEISKIFLIVKTDGLGHVEKGRIVQLQREKDTGITAQLMFNGFISISTLSNNVLIQSKVENGFIAAFHQQLSAREMLKGEDVLPEVVVVAYVHYDSGIDYSTWLWLSSLFYNTDSGTGGTGSSGSGYYGSIDGGGGGGSYGSGGYSSGNGDPYQESLLEYEGEYIYSLPEIDVWKFFNCFNTVPSVGAIYIIKLCVDVPSNNNPGASSTSSGSSAGHTFLTVTKSNGDSKITQSFGFYPKSEPSFFDPFASVGSAMKDNGGNEYNAAIEMNISEDQFEKIKNNAIVWAVNPYTLSDYNCTNYALDVFNSVRSVPIAIAPYKVVLPGAPNPWGESEPITINIEKSPQMLFFKLQAMKNNNEPEAGKIQIDQTHNSVSPVSHGECN